MDKQNTTKNIFDKRVTEKEMDKDLIWGVVSAAYQIEGAENEGGRCPSILDKQFTKVKIVGDMNGGVACDRKCKGREIPRKEGAIRIRGKRK